MKPRQTAIKRRVPLKKVSAKRQKEGRIYSKLRKEFLERHPICQVCADYQDKIHHVRLSVHVHHKHGRYGPAYLDTTHWLAVCENHHQEIHNRPSWARAQGYLK